MYCCADRLSPADSELRSNVLGSAQQGGAYLIEMASDPTPSTVQVTGIAATAVKNLGSRTIGM